ncbi:MFS transporter [Metabacillus sp. GX 13764]|uniref:MFS transporter n=1 Tax=Metabacillus kandeliae TaxID=2900151 RepID=UPI001E378A2A|nr:MFS transporter [Metabacillus kandeliae]MCD7034370.1 MFS transporter [Metabacillus kandeliae]
MNKQESRYRWLVLSISLFAYFVIVSQRTAPGLVTDTLMSEFHVSAAVIGLMSSIQFFAYAGLQIPVGLLSDRFGPNRFLIAGTLLNGIGCLIFSLAPNEGLLIFARFLAGLGDAAIFVNVILIFSGWFKAGEFIKLMGMVSLAGSIGALTATFPYSAWISAAGWRQPFLVIGIVLLVTASLLHYILVARPKKTFKEEEKIKKVPEKAPESVWSILKRMFAARQAWATFLCHFGVVGTYIGFIGSWGVPYGIHVFGLSRSAASQLMMYGLIGAMIGGPLISWITSRLGVIKKIYSLVHLIVFLSWCGLFLTGTNPSFIVAVSLFVVIGFGNGASSLTFAAVRSSFRVEEVGVISGFSNMGGFLSAVLLPIVFGQVLDLFPAAAANEGYHYGFLIPVLFSLLGLTGALLLKEEGKQRETV